MLINEESLRRKTGACKVTLWRTSWIYIIVGSAESADPHIYIWARNVHLIHRTIKAKMAIGATATIRWNLTSTLLSPLIEIDLTGRSYKRNDQQPWLIKQNFNQNQLTVQYKKHLCTALISSALLASTACTTRPVVLGVTGGTDNIEDQNLASLSAAEDNSDPEADNVPLLNSRSNTPEAPRGNWVSRNLSCCCPCFFNRHRGPSPPSCKSDRFDT